MLFVDFICSTTVEVRVRARVYVFAEQTFEITSTLFATGALYAPLRYVNSRLVPQQERKKEEEEEEEVCKRQIDRTVTV